MFQDIAPHTYNNDFAWVAPEPTDCVLIYEGEAILARTSEGELELPRFAYCNSAEANTPASEVAGIALPQPAKGVYLFSVGECAYFFVSVAEADLAKLRQGGFEFHAVNQLKDGGFQKRKVFAAMVGLEYHNWYTTRRFCGACGQAMVHDLVERMMRCPACNTMEFPKVFPAVIVAVVNPENGKVLVSRYAGREYTRYALIAGFAEMGETIEQTVHREVMEEVGLRVKNLRYVASQPWPYSSSLLMGFVCELDGSDEITLDTHELEYATWLEPCELPTDDADYSLTRHIMKMLREGHFGEVWRSAK